MLLRILRYDHYYGIGGMYANIGGMGLGEMYASAKYIDLLNEQDVTTGVRIITKS